MRADFVALMEEIFTRERMISYWRGLGFKVTNEPQVNKLYYLIKDESEHFLMARGKSKSTSTPKFGIEFIKANMSAEEKSAFLAFEINTEEIAESLLNFVDNGYKLSVGYDKNNDSCYATLTNKDGDKSFVGKALTCHAKTSRQALSLIIFKHTVLADGDWSYWDGDIEADFG